MTAHRFWNQTLAGAALALTLAIPAIATPETPAKRRPQQPQPPFPYTEEEVTYTNGEIRLAATLTLPEGPGPFPAVVLLTGSGTQNRDEEIDGHRPFALVADDLARAGVAVLRVDDRGAGGSTGKVRDSTTSDFAEDALAGVRLLRAHPRIARDRVGLLGHSEGGATGPLAAARSSDVAFVVMLAGPGVPGPEILLHQIEVMSRVDGMPEDKIRRLLELERRAVDLVLTEIDPQRLTAGLRQVFQEELAVTDPVEIEQSGGPEAWVELHARVYSSAWFRHFAGLDPRPALRRVKVPVLALNGGLDRQVAPAQNLPEIEKALRAAGNPDVTVRELPGLNHLFQTAKTGNPSEYGEIEETLAPAALDAVRDWIVTRFVR